MRIFSSHGRRSLPALALLGAVILGVAGLRAVPVDADAPAQEAEAATFEVAFMTGMIDHHAMAVEMAGMCVDMAVHDELRSMCESIIESQGTEIDSMQTWLADWYSTAHEPEMTAGEMQEMARLHTLSGADFEIDFMQQMMMHHAMAVEEAQECGTQAEHEELLALCANIIESQAAEIDQMEQWLCTWHDQCDGGSPTPTATATTTSTATATPSTSPTASATRTATPAAPGAATTPPSTRTAVPGTPVPPRTGMGGSLNEEDRGLSDVMLVGLGLTIAGGLWLAERKRRQS